MDTSLVLLVVLGLVAGVMSGMFGIGGGVIIVPALILAAGFSQVQANGTSLGALLLPVGILAVLTYYRAKLIDIQASALIALGLLIGVFGGAQLAVNLPATILKQLYGVFLLWIGWRFAEPLVLWRAWRGGTPVTPRVPEAVTAEQTPRLSNWLILLVGIVAGVMSGLFGIGGGAVIVPALVAFMHFDQKLAVGTSLGALMLPVGLPGVIVYYQAGELSLATALPVAIGLVIGAVGGARLAIGLPSKTVKRLYGFFLLLMGLNFILPIQTWLR
ncbi:MAG: sulfite exporter TauE/SafE family protein [Anaerolineae bacterium]